MFKSFWEDIKLQFRMGNMVTRLLLVNVAVFVFLILLRFLLLPFSKGFTDSTIFDGIMSWLMVPSDGLKLLTRPWTVITYMFLHEGLLHLVMNMLFLLLGGRVLKDYVGNDKILAVYVYGGLAGFLAFFLGANLLPPGFSSFIGGQMLGASAGVMAIIMAAATKAPDHQVNLMFLGPVKMKWIAFALIILDLIAIQKGSNTGGHLAHLGGVAVGYFFINQLNVGNDWSKGFNRVFDKVSGFALSIFNNNAQPKRQMEYSKTQKKPTQKQARKKRPQRPSADSLTRQERIDAILDKIRESGYDSLTKEEKEFLFKASKED